MRVIITIDDELVQKARATASKQQKSLSAFISETVRLRIERLEREQAFRILENLRSDDFAKENYK